MEKKKKSTKFLKKKLWKARFASRLKGRVSEIYDDYFSGRWDREVKNQNRPSRFTRWHDPGTAA